jgi:hypothetical protein
MYCFSAIRQQAMLYLPSLKTKKKNQGLNTETRQVYYHGPYFLCDLTADTASGFSSPGVSKLKSGLIY